MTENGEVLSNFELSAVRESVSRCQRADGAVLIDEYINAYQQLVKFFNLLGSVFMFVTSDVNSKLGILKHHRTHEAGMHYETIQSMVSYEIKNNLTRVRTSPLSGCRTLLRLHRALNFIMHLFNGLTAMSSNDKMSEVVWKAYDDTIARYHTWLIRKTVGVAVYAVPSRATLCSKLHAGTEEEVINVFQQIVAEIQPVYNTVQTLYADNDILDLP